MLEWIVRLLHSLPHLNFKFKSVDAIFSLDVRSDYAQSLLVIAAAVGAISLLLLLTIIAVWICRCCARDDATVKSRRQVRRLSTILFVISVLCFASLGACLFGNEQINRGVTASATGLGDIAKAIRHASVVSARLNETRAQAAEHIRSLVQLVFEESKKPGVNKTLVDQIDSSLTQISDGVEGMGQKLRHIGEVTTSIVFLEQAKTVGERVEVERWLLIATLLSISICVLFAGVIGFCRQSKKGAVVFSGLGFVIFIVAALLSAVVIPATVSHADFCSSGRQFVSARLRKEMLEALDFYQSCRPSPTHDNIPPHIGVAEVSDALSKAQSEKTALDGLLDAAFNRSQEVTKASALLSDDVGQALKLVGSLESSLGCYAYKDDVDALTTGFCQQAMIGSALLAVSLVLLIIFLFALLIVVSKSWNLFTRLPSDYIEVDEDDPFYPRAAGVGGGHGYDSSVPVDIYGTHVLQPTRQGRAGEPSTGTTTATVPVGADEQPLWNSRGGGGGGGVGLSTSLSRGGVAANYGNYGNYSGHQGDF